VKEVFLTRFSQILERDLEITLEDEFRLYEEWDSLTFLSILSMIDDEYGVNIDSKTFERLTTVEDIYDFIHAKN
tara:strand:+ start:284 stop:505 length:222 start_codon:yes stop_codon:yes gene_type:complete